MTTVTKFWFFGTLLVSYAARLHFVSPESLVLDLDHINEVWRFVTALLFYPLKEHTGWTFLVNLYLLMAYSGSLETEEYGDRPADYAFMFLINWTLSVGLSLLLQAQTTFMSLNPVLLLQPMLFSIIYVWCNLPENNIEPLDFGIKIRVRKFPWCLLVFNFILGGSCAYELIGYTVGYLYYSLKYQYPIIHTPGFLDGFFPPGGDE